LIRREQRLDASRLALKPASVFSPATRHGVSRDGTTTTAEATILTEIDNG